MGVFREFSFTMGATSGSASVTIDQAYTKIYMQVPTFTSIAALQLSASPDGTQTFYQVANEIPNSTTVQCWPFAIPATATSGGFIVPIPAGMLAYKVVADSVPTTALNFKLICGE